MSSRSRIHENSHVDTCKTKGANPGERIPSKKIWTSNKQNEENVDGYKQRGKIKKRSKLVEGVKILSFKKWKNLYIYIYRNRIREELTRR